jgi:Carbohydrate-binding module family 5/12
MSEPYWVALGSKIPIDYIGGWSAAVSYKAGDVVSYNGVDYIAVNPSTGSTPPPATSLGAVGIGTSLPASPLDGQEYVLVDSLTAPTYSWRFRYVPGIADAYKWVYVGGSAIMNEQPALDTCAITTYTALGSAGPSVALPRAGIFEVALGFNNRMDNNTTANRTHWMSYDIGATAAVDADAVLGGATNAGQNALGGFSRHMRKTIATAVTLTAKYKVPDQAAGAGSFQARWMKITPVRVS